MRLGIGTPGRKKRKINRAYVHVQNIYEIFILKLISIYLPE